MPSLTPAIARYLPVEPSARDWGLHVIDIGMTSIRPGIAYPSIQHPDGYLFTWQRGRTLTEYQLVYITRGRGVLESQTAGKMRIDGGNVFLLFPGEWHRYRPDQKTGWDEYWIGFDGDYARQLMDRFFTATQPVMQIGHDEELLRLIQTAADLVESAPPGFQQMMAGYTVTVLARIRALAMCGHSPTDYHERRLHKARTLLLEHAAEEVDLQLLAKNLGYSYSRFRHLFRMHTGLSPRQYQLEIRLNRARYLLKGTDLTITEIADRLGFCSVYYFSRLFKKRHGQSPCEFRNE